MKTERTRVLIIDDSSIVHTLLGKVFAGHEDLAVAGDAYDGASGVQLAKESSPDVIIMDINMPGMGGLEAIEEIMAEKPAPIIVFSSGSRDIVDLSFKAIELGAVDLVEKPSAPDLSSLKAVIEDKLVRTIRTFADFRVMRRFKKRTMPVLPHGIHAHHPVAHGTPVSGAGARLVPATTRPVGDAGAFFVIAVASSTGGPQMLHALLQQPELAPLAAGVIVLQHLAEGFIDGFVDWLGVFSVLPVVVAGVGEFMARGLVQVAPAGRHLGVNGEGRFISIDQPPRFGIRPSADVLFDSLAENLGSRLITVVLSGMGSDGSHALPKVKQCGGYVIAQDEESSLIFGMPKAAIETGAVDAVLNIRQIPGFLARYCGGDAAGHAF
jgi:two-component system, chemotaxis family, protein-glutamate methylesterase/glutaminase